MSSLTFNWTSLVYKIQGRRQDLTSYRILDSFTCHVSAQVWIPVKQRWENSSFGVDFRCALPIATLKYLFLHDSKEFLQLSNVILPMGTFPEAN